MKTPIVLILAALSLAGCMSPPKPEYWVKPGATLQGTGTDLSECRIAGNSGGQKVFSARELESPCMASKGYTLSTTLPKF